MTVKQLLERLQNFVDNGYGHARVLFDTEAKIYDCHLVEVKSAFLLSVFDPEDPMVTLHE